MSRIDISIKNKKTNEWIVNRGFCRTPELEFFCENSNDEKLVDFDNSIIMGISLDKKNFSDFLDTVQYIIDYLLAIPTDYINENYDEVHKGMRNTFIAELREGKNFIEDFVSNHELDDYKVKIVQ